MIATNFRKYPDAQLAQLELDLGGVVGADEQQRGAFWSWLMNTGTFIDLPKRPAPAWWAAAKRKAVALAKSVKTALLAFVFNPE